MKLGTISIWIVLAVGFALACSSKRSAPGKKGYVASSFSNDQTHLEQAIRAAGGLAAWFKWNRLSFDKHTELYDSAGSLESDLRQHIVWQRTPPSVVIRWQDEEKVNHEIMADHRGMRKLENGQEQTQMDTQALINSLSAAKYVMSLPFKLAEPGYQIEYEQVDTLPSGATVHLLQARYSEDGDPVKDSDVWWHQFHTDTYLQMGYMVKHLDHISLIENLENTKVAGIIWPIHRKSWRINSIGQKQYLRATYHYSNYVVQ